jgi:hypothetical protein
MHKIIQEKGKNFLVSFRDVFFLEEILFEKEKHTMEEWRDEWEEFTNVFLVDSSGKEPIQEQEKLPHNLEIVSKKESSNQNKKLVEKQEQEVWQCLDAITKIFMVNGVVQNVFK